MKLILTVCLCIMLGQSYGQDIISIGNDITGSTHTLKGKIQDEETRELLVGVNIVIDETQSGTITDVNGNFRLDNLSFGKIYTLKISSIGYESKLVPILIKGNGSIKIELTSSFVELDEVIVSGEAADKNVTSNDIGKSVIKLETIKELPQIAGEVDLFKTIALLPGVSSAGEASSGVNVRGGGLDQNLILYGYIPLYNPSHLFGFFSAVNSDAIDQIELYKGVMPVKYGGRSSAVLKMTPKVGNYSNWSGKVQLGMISSKITFDGPIVKNKLSLSSNFRISYINWLLGSINDADIRNSSADFYDGSANIEYRLNDNNVLSYTFYRSNDSFNLASDTTNGWANQGQEFKWKHSFSKKLFSELVLVDARYSFDISNDTGANPFELNSDISNRIGILDFNYQLNPKNSFNFGAQAVYHVINPGELNPIGSSNLLYKKIEDEQALELSAYASHDLNIGDRFSINYGVRYNSYSYLGPKNVNEYREILPKSDNNVIETNFFEEDETIYDYDLLAPRVGVRFSLSESLSIKAGYNVSNQFIQVISNTANINPVNIWKLSDSFNEAQKSDQYSAGVFKNLFNNKIEVSLEGYYRKFDNLIDYKDGAELLLNDNIETELITADGESYGLEFYINKKSGMFTGWFSYTYARSFRRAVSAFPESEINNGEKFPSNFDKPHDFTVVSNYKPNPFFTLSAIFTYSTGRPVTYPSAKFEYNNQQVAYYNSRNQDRIPNYHRLDLSLTFKSRSPKKFLSGEWNFTIYNVYGRKNAYSVFFDDQPGRPPQAFQLSVLNSPFPSLSYSLNIN